MTAQPPIASPCETGLVKHRCCNFDWELSPDFVPWLDSLIESSGETVKKTRTSWVTRHRSGQRAFYFKRLRHEGSWLLPLKFLFREPRTQAEWSLAPRLQNLGVACVPHWAYGEHWSWRGLLESALVTEAPAGYEPLPEADEHTAPALQRALGRFFRRLHEAGVDHADLQPNNVLYSAPADACCLVDLDNIEIRSALTLDDRIQTVALLGAHFPLTQSFFDSYGGELRDASREVANRARQILHTDAAETARRWRRHVHLNQIQRVGALDWHVRLSDCNHQLLKILEDPNRFLEERAEILKPGRSTKVGRADGLVVKRFNVRRITRPIKGLFRTSHALRAYQKALHLELLNIPTARPLAAAERRCCRLLLRSYFVMEEIPGASSLAHWSGERKQALRSLADLIGRMHEAGLAHRDLKESNILINRLGQAYLIDLEGMRYMRSVPDQRAIADLTRLAREALMYRQASRTECARFLKQYCGVRRRSDWRWWWREIAGKPGLSS